MTHEPSPRSSDSPREIDPWERFLNLYASAKSLVASVASFALICLYFVVYWQFKDRLRVSLRNGALAFMSLSLFVFIFEVVLKFVAPNLMREFASFLPETQFAMIGLYVLSGFIVISYNVFEMGHRKNERAFTEVVWALFNKKICGSGSDDLQGTLNLVHKAFRYHGITRVSIWSRCGSDLVVADGHWYPIESVSPLRELKGNDGLAGLVFEDSRLRYVPRLFFPFNRKRLRRLSFSFFHALTFEIISAQNKSVDVVGRRVAPNVLAFPDGSDPSSLSSFVAVPIIDPRTNICVGVLCLDFAGTDPLDHGGIKAAAVFGYLLAMQVDLGAAAA